MEEKNINRSKKMKEELLDKGADELTKVGNEVIHIVIQDVKEWVRNKYNGFKSSATADTESELNKLEIRIAISNENVKIGMEKKEIAVMWAMRKLGYSEEETQQVLNMANEAYKLRD